MYGCGLLCVVFVGALLRGMCLVVLLVGEIMRYISWFVLLSMFWLAFWWLY